MLSSITFISILVDFAYLSALLLCLSFLIDSCFAKEKGQDLSNPLKIKQCQKTTYSFSGIYFEMIFLVNLYQE